MKVRVAFLVLLTVAVCRNGFGYVQSVHRIMTVNAFLQANANLVQHLGSDVDMIQARLRMSDGAYHEDDGWRSLNHFFDPVYGLALNAPFPACLLLGDRADSYAVRDSDNAVFFANNQYEAAVAGPNPGSRGPHIDELFTMLGHEVHLLEDMAQPEHTRNDQHRWPVGGATAASIYEDWGAENLIIDATRGLPAVPYDGYAPVDLPTYLDYFHTSDGRGLADFSNGNFFTQDTNVQDESPFTTCDVFRKPLLDLSDAGERVESVNEEYRDPLLGIRTMVVAERIWTSHPYDAFRQIPELDSYHDLSSIIDLETRTLLNTPTYSLSTGSYLFQASLLVPRAVGYAAGYIEHFFRGSIGVEWTRQPASVGYYDLKITNQSAQFLSDDATVQALFKANPSYFGRTTQDDTSIIVRKTRISELVPSFSGLQPGASVTIPNLAVADLIGSDNLNDFERRTVLRGTLGGEEAVLSLVQGARPQPQMRFEVSWVGHNLATEPCTGVGLAPYNYLIGPVFSWSPLYCNTYAIIGDWCLASAPARDLSGATAVFTVSKNVTGSKYWVSFCNEYGGSMDVTVKTYENGVLKKTFQQPNLDMNFNNMQRTLQFYP